MGWDFCDAWTTKAKVVHAILTGNSRSFTAHKLVGNELWVINGTPADGGDSYIGLYLLEKEGRTWGYKPLTESSGPYYYNCPLAFLDAVPLANHEWRLKVLAVAATKAALKAVKPGDTLAIGNGWKAASFIVKTAKPLVAHNPADGRDYKVNPKSVVAVIPGA